MKKIAILQLGGIGHLGTFSFHETKNIQSGEGGLISINDQAFIKRSEIIWEKGTNRAEFFRGEINKYGWVDTGSSFLTSDIIAAFLYAQIEELHTIQERRLSIWQRYYQELLPFSKKGVKLPYIPSYATNNAHMFYLVLPSLKERSYFISRMKEMGCSPVFHYLSLHKSDFYKDKHDGRILTNSDRYSDCLVRLPFYFELQDDGLDRVVESAKKALEEICK